MPITTELTLVPVTGGCILWLVHQPEKKLQLAKIVRNELNQMEWNELNGVFSSWLRSRATDLGPVNSWNDVEQVGQHFVAYLSNLSVMLTWSRE